MAARRFCGKVLPAGTLSEVVKCESVNGAVATITFVNQGKQPAKLSLAYVRSHAIEDARNSDWLFVNVVLNSGAIKEVKGIPVENGTMLAAKFDNVGEETIVNVVAYGLDC